MAGFRDRAEEALRKAAAPTLEGIRRDAEVEDLPGQVRKLLDYLDEHLFDPGLNVTTWRQGVGIRDNSASTEMRAWLGRSPLQYLTERRLETAARMLAATDLEERRIARAVGFTSYQTFGKRYKAWAGEPPSKDRDAPATEIDAQTWRRAFRGELGREEAEQLIRALRRLYPGTDEARRSRDPAPTARTVIDGADWERFQAEALWQRIRGLPAADQKRQVTGHLFRSTVLFDLLRKSSVEEGRKDREAGVRLAKLALVSLEGHEEVFGERIHDLRALGWAWLGNARRLSFDLSRAEADFGKAEREWSMPRAERDPGIGGELDLLTGTLRLFQRRYEVAVELLSNAVEAAARIGDRSLETRALIQRAAAKGYAQRSEAACHDLLKVISQNEGGDPFLAFAAHTNLANLESRSGRIPSAVAYLEKAKSYCSPLDHAFGWFEIRHLEGNVKASAGDRAGAESCFQEASRGFSSLDQHGRAALVLIDLALLYTGQGRWAETRELVPAIPVALQTMTLHPETLAAISVFASAVAAREISQAALNELRKHLRSDPLIALNFQAA